VKRFLIATVAAMGFLPDLPLYACTAFCISRDDLVLVGNNEDWKNPNTKIWYEPAEEEKYGRVYFGFDNFYPQSGMNEEGLVFDGFATSPNEVKKSLNKPTCCTNLMDKVVSECATVDEALEIFDKYNLKFMERAMFLIADEQGDSAIIEGDERMLSDGITPTNTEHYMARKVLSSGIATCHKSRK
jgi:penicillin V acylase-like amidase (Ntn superfamily)